MHLPLRAYLLFCVARPFLANKTHLSIHRSTRAAFSLRDGSSTARCSLGSKSDAFVQKFHHARSCGTFRRYMVSFSSSGFRFFVRNPHLETDHAELATKPRARTGGICIDF